MNKLELNRLEYTQVEYLRAMEMAYYAHRNQIYGRSPYVRHLAHVDSLLWYFELQSAPLHIAAWLHDIVEDTEVTLEDIKENFSEEVYKYVEAVTDGKGKNRKERKELSYQKIREYPPAIILKLADRIANVESCVYENNRDLFKMYQKEHPEFSKQLDKEKAIGTARVMWEYLDGLLK